MKEKEGSGCENKKGMVKQSPYSIAER
jgi:hypothetical protein